MPNAFARLPSDWPIAPHPDDPERLALQPGPQQHEHVHDHGSRARMSRSPSPIRRVTARISVIARSAVASVSTAACSSTSTPRLVAAGTSMLSKPTATLQTGAELVAGGVEEGVVDLVVQERDHDVRARDRVVQLRDLERPVVGRDPDVTRLARISTAGSGMRRVTTILGSGMAGQHIRPPAAQASWRPRTSRCAHGRSSRLKRAVESRSGRR